MEKNAGEFKVVVALGSNIEPRAEYLAKALSALEAMDSTRLAAVSEIEETEPVGVEERYREFKFLNRVAIFHTALSPDAFSRRMHAIEEELGRVRPSPRNSPRTIDIDMIDYEGVTSESAELTLPHPRAKERDFVWRPWMELEKKLLRARMKRLRAEVSGEERAAKSHELCAKLAELLGPAKIVCCYEALKTELDLGEFIESCRARGVEVVVPQSDGGKPARYYVPKNSEVDLWICPGLAFTPAGERIGFGGGWYDRFLAAAKPGARAYAVAYGFQIVDKLPQGEWDCRLDGIVSV
jgi:2-amino-4-hydroxy-6-hydroxymethyldihydropteridine diphosphokinase